MSKNISRMHDDNRSLVKTVSGLNARIEQLETDKVKLKKDIAGLNGNIAELYKAKAEMSDKMGTLSKRLTDSEFKAKYVEERLKRVIARLDSLQLLCLHRFIDRTDTLLIEVDSIIGKWVVFMTRLEQTIVNSGESFGCESNKYCILCKFWKVYCAKQVAKYMITRPQWKNYAWCAKSRLPLRRCEL